MKFKKFSDSPATLILIEQPNVFRFACGTELITLIQGYFPVMPESTDLRLGKKLLISEFVPESITGIFTIRQNILIARMQSVIAPSSAGSSSMKNNKLFTSIL